MTTETASAAIVEGVQLEVSEPIIARRPNALDLQRIASTNLSELTDMEVDSPAMRALALESVQTVKRMHKLLTEQQKELLAPFKLGEEGIRSLYREPLAVLENAERIGKAKILKFDQAEEAKAREEQRRHEEAARAERQRAEEAARVEQEEARRKQEQANTEARQLEAAGDFVTAATIQNNAAVQVAEAASRANVSLQTAAALAAPLPTQPASKGSGASARKKWKARVTDKLKLVQFVAENIAYLHLLEVDESALNKVAAAMQENMNAAIPGVLAYPDATLAVRTKAAAPAAA
jgi:hypothetical protein